LVFNNGKHFIGIACNDSTCLVNDQHDYCFLLTTTLDLAVNHLRVFGGLSSWNSGLSFLGRDSHRLFIYCNICAWSYVDSFLSRKGSEMVQNSINNPRILNWKGRWRSLVLPIILLLSVSLVARYVVCNQAPSDQLYENPESGISLLKPPNWNVEFYERNGVILLESKNDQNSARIEIYGNACYPGTWLNRPDEALVADVERIQNRYNLASAPIIQESTNVETGDNDAIRVIIAIPTAAMLEDTSRIQVGDRGPDTLQTIAIYAISNQGIPILVYIYEGDDDALNDQAREIVESIQFICTPEP